VLTTYVTECFLCRAPSTRVVWRENGYEARRCGCGLVYSHPMPPPDAVDCTVDHHPAEFYSYPAAFKARWMAARCPDGRLLEVGCGDGYFLAAARACGYQVFGLEPHGGRARYVAETLRIDVEPRALEDTTLPDGHFDVVYHCDLLSHFADPVAALRRMTRLLRQGGVLCFEVGILGGISPVWYRLVGEVGLGYHRWLYSPGAVRALLAQADLATEHVQRFGLAPRAIAGGMSASLRRLGRRSAPRALGTEQAPAPASRWRRLDRWLSTLLRYRLAAVAPRVGPETWLVVARPVSRAATG
jgi:SAM-dependent methyltransferase